MNGRKSRLFRKLAAQIWLKTLTPEERAKVGSVKTLYKRLKKANGRGYIS